MLLLDMETMISNIAMFYECNHTVQYTTSGFYRFKLIFILARHELAIDDGAELPVVKLVVEAL